MNRRSSSSISRVKRTMKHATTVLRQFAWLSILSIVITNNSNNNHSVVCAFTFIGLKSSSISFRIQNHKENNQRQRFQQAHQSRRNSILPSLAVTTGNNNNNNNNKKNSDSDNEKTAKEQQQRSKDETEKEFLEREIEHLNSLEELLAELEEQEEDTDYRNDGENTLSMYKNHNDDDDDDLFDHDEFIDFFGSLPDDVDPEELAQLEQEMMFLAAEADDDNDDDGIDDGDDYDFDLEFENEDDMNDFVEDFVDEMSMEEEDDEIETTMEKDTAESKEKVEEASSSSSSFIPSSVDIKASSLFEDALLQGVVPADAGVGKSNLPGDFGFDPFNMATKDYIRTVQSFFWNLIPGDPNDTDFQAKAAKWNEPRPPALILRDYREAEIRHGRLAMMAAMIWPLQEMLDRLLLEEYQYSSTTIVYGGVTLPYLSLFMTLIMMLLGYLDIYANVIKDMDDVGEAFLPGDCFWDPLSILEGAPATMKRNMQERELFNGRFAMIAIAFYVFEEATTHKPIISIPGNELLFEPAYQISYIQSWLDSIFASPSPVFVLPDVGSVDFADAVNQVLQEEETVRKILQDGGEVLYTDIP